MSEDNSQSFTSHQQPPPIRAKKSADRKLTQDELLRFHRDTMVCLKKDLQAEQNGERLVVSFQTKPSKILCTYARKWLTLHKNSDDVPALVGAWIKAYPSDEIADIAALVLTSNSFHPDNLHPIIWSIFQYFPRADLMDIIESLVEQYPKLTVWWASAPPHLPSARIETIVTTSIRLNRNTPGLFLLVAALYTTNAELLSEIIEWLRLNAETAEGCANTINEVFGKASALHRELVPAIEEVARDWIKRNPDHKECGTVFAGIINDSGLDSDIETAWQWCQIHQPGKPNWRLLEAISKHFSVSNSPVAQLAMIETKKLFKADSKHSPRLLKNLLLAQPDPEVVQWVADYCAADEKSWLWEHLLQSAPSMELTKKCHSLLKKYRGTPFEYIYVRALIRAEPSNEKVLKLAVDWIKRNSENAQCADMMKLISE